MSEKKNIDRLFQEKFKDFEATPPEFVWDNIKEALEEKKKRRVIPLWLRLGGVAAVLVLGLLTGIFYLNGWDGAQQQDPAITTAPNSNNEQSPLQTLPTDVNTNTLIDSGKNRKNPSSGIDKNAVVVSSKNNDQLNQVHSSQKSSASDKIQNNTAPKTISPKNNAIVNNSKNTYNNNSGKTGAKQNTLLPPDNNTIVNRNNQKGKGIAQPNNAVANNSAMQNNNSKDNTVKSGITNTNRIGQPNTATAVAENNNVSSRNDSANKNNSTNSAPGNNSTTNNSAFNKNNSIANNNSATNKNNAAQGNTKNGIAINSNTQNNNSVAENQKAENNVIDTDATIIDKTTSIEDKAVAETTVDTTATEPENELEKLLREKQEDKDNKKDKQLADNSNKSRWNVKPQVAPVFYNSMSSNGSPIDDQFAGNTKSYDNNLSMGVGVNYALTDRINIRSGVNTVNLNYATKGIEFYASLTGQTNNVAARTSSANIVVQDQGRPNVLEAFFADRLPNETFRGSMIQRTGYVEVPVEMSYALLNKKFGIDIIGGVSTLFLNQNNVSVISTQGYSTNVGKAQNLNDIHFSTNLGVGFKYRFFKSFEANFEPMFKYQVNTFSRDAGNFKPYFIGLYSGISFSF
ncbi:hypothetical protein GR160_09005 [Flavobacterium sp. Sd200]|uniref:PorT family protein n=1 Tax=Flavobacterium sp. Sd200 TaxID=2692211 RepID=UPI00136AD2A6|nr:PorT family protein [Flavobacterium sp. Sd200]MXN91366.1 hypothetical protein [Flavobacterium sp. Sd200]